MIEAESAARSLGVQLVVENVSTPSEIEAAFATLSLRAVMWQIAMGVVSKTDENGNFIVEACGQPNMKMARHFLEWQRPEKWGKASEETRSA